MTGCVHNRGVKQTRQVLHHRNTFNVHVQCVQTTIEQTVYAIYTLKLFQNGCIKQLDNSVCLCALKTNLILVAPVND